MWRRRRRAPERWRLGLSPDIVGVAKSRRARHACHDALICVLGVGQSLAEGESVG
jgi:hypothetical protein